MKFLFLVFWMLAAFGVQASEYPKSDHFDGKKFFNPEKNNDNNFYDVLKWKMTTESSSWPDHIPNKTYPFPVLAPNDRAIVTFINHASFLIQFSDLKILTDPIFSERCSPFKFMGPKRIRGPGLKLEELPPIDVVLISHNHYDHLDLESIKSLDKKFHPLFLVPLGDAKLLLQAGVENVKEMDWWQEILIKGHKFVFTPAQHWSGRGPFDKRDSLWGSYFILSPKFKTFFGGDTGYSTHFRNIKLRLGSPDLALLPIGAYDPRYFMKIDHMNPEEAVIAHKDLGSTFSLGMHFGTFQLTDEAIYEPVERLKNQKIENFTVLDQGESKSFL